MYANEYINGGGVCVVCKKEINYQIYGDVDVLFVSQKVSLDVCEIFANCLCVCVLMLSMIHRAARAFLALNGVFRRVLYWIMEVWDPSSRAMSLSVTP